MGGRKNWKGHVSESLSYLLRVLHTHPCVHTHTSTCYLLIMQQVHSVPHILITADQHCEGPSPPPPFTVVRTVIGIMHSPIA